MPGIEDLRSVADTSFEEVESHFKDWLEQSGISSDLLWVLREDVLFVNDQIYLRKPIDPENYARTKALYEKGQERSLGVGLHGFCLLENRLCCHLILPEDEIDAEYMMLSKHAVKYSWRTNLPKARKISNGMIWRMRTWQSNFQRSVLLDDYFQSKLWQ